MKFENTKSFIEFYKEIGLDQIFNRETVSKFKKIDKESKLIKTTNKNKESEDKKFKLNLLKEKVMNTSLGLKDTSTNMVFSIGNFKSNLMIIGDKPQPADDRSSVPFSADDGILLQKMLGSIGLNLNKYYLTNIIFWRPPGDRVVSEEELKECLKYTNEHISIINPDFIILLGGLVTNSILGLNQNILKTRGKIFEKVFSSKNVKLFPIFHPKFLLSNPIEKKKTWFDLCKISKAIER